jgi:hypothetical protein
VVAAREFGKRGTFSAALAGLVLHKRTMTLLSGVGADDDAAGLGGSLHSAKPPSTVSISRSCAVVECLSAGDY